MFKWLGQWREIKKQPKASSSASVRSILKTAVADAEQVVASITMKAQAEAEEEAARIIAQANQEAEEIKRSAETAVEKGVEDILSVANRQAESTEVEAEPAALSRVGEEIVEEKVEKPAPEFGMWESNINVVMSGDPPYEDICGTPPIRGLLCKIYKVAED